VGQRRRPLVIGVHAPEALIRAAEQQADWTGMLLDRPDGDWPLLVFIGSMRGEVAIYLGPCDPPTGVRESGRFSFEELPALLWQRRVAEPERVPRAAVLMPTWCPLRRAAEDASVGAGGRRRRGAQPQQARLLFEGLSLHAADASECRALQAPIIRRERKPPLVSEWEGMDACDRRAMGFLRHMVGAEAATKIEA
jgi:hypothetical protein